MMEQEYIELTNHRAMIEIPENAVEVRMIVKVYVDGEIETVSSTLNQEMIREAFRKADDGYIDEDDRFVLTENGLRYLEELERERNSQ
jgi:hypothetical protein